MKAKRASLQNYDFHLDSSDEEDALNDKNKLKSGRGDDLDAIAQYEKE